MRPLTVMFHYCVNKLKHLILRNAMAPQNHMLPIWVYFTNLFSQSRATQILLMLLMATPFGKNIPKYGAQHKHCSLKYVVKFQQKCPWNRTPSFAPFTLCWHLRISQIGWWNWHFMSLILITDASDRWQSAINDHQGVDWGYNRVPIT